MPGGEHQVVGILYLHDAASRCEVFVASLSGKREKAPLLPFAKATTFNMSGRYDRVDELLWPLAPRCMEFTTLPQDAAISRCTHCHGYILDIA
jgi:hypothetical protein